MADVAELIRPGSLEEVIGNEPTKIKLDDWLSADEKHRALLLVGDIGCGKTLLADLTATALGAPKKSPYRLVVPVSRYTNEYFRDITDTMGSRSGIALRKGCREVYVFDEAHFIPELAQGMLLAPVASPAEGTVIIFLTSRPEELDPALRSRCLELEVGPLTRSETLKLLERGCSATGVRLASEVLRDIAKGSKGNPRSALIKLGTELNRAKAERKKNLQVQEGSFHE